ncbi:MAG: DUF1080 domain-containing protein, partial [Pedobacter sp.]
MKKILLAAFMVATITLNVSAQKNKGFIPLFDGKTTTGWHTYGKDFVGKAWN